MRGLRLLVVEGLREMLNEIKDRWLWRICLSVCVIGLVLAAAVHLRHVNTTTVALVRVPAVLCIALKWGWLEALAAALVAGLGLDYFFLPPHGFGIEKPGHWVAFFAFLVTAPAAGQLSARANRNRGEAVLRRVEIEKLYRRGYLISHGENADVIVQAARRRAQGNSWSGSYRDL